eukprot:COSAG06_NODE_1871_length_8166_cov_129.883228_7_plen_46_part_00
MKNDVQIVSEDCTLITINSDLLQLCLGHVAEIIPWGWLVGGLLPG